jgi:hypothetical protein
MLATPSALRSGCQPSGSVIRRRENDPSYRGYLECNIGLNNPIPWFGPECGNSEHGTKVVGIRHKALGQEPCWSLRLQSSGANALLSYMPTPVCLLSVPSATRTVLPSSRLGGWINDDLEVEMMVTPGTSTIGNTSFGIVAIAPAPRNTMQFAKTKNVLRNFRAYLIRSTADAFALRRMTKRKVTSNLIARPGHEDQFSRRIHLDWVGSRRGVPIRRLRNINSLNCELHQATSVKLDGALVCARHTLVCLRALSYQRTTRVGIRTRRRKARSPVALPPQDRLLVASEDSLRHAAPASPSRSHSNLAGKAKTKV